MRCPNEALPAEVHTRAIALVREIGCDASAKRCGISAATMQRALAFVKVSPLVRSAIERGVAANTTEALAG